IPQLPRIYSEPFADSSQVPTYLVSRIARRHVTVALSGDGGDEVLGGYTRYMWARHLWEPLHRIPYGVQRAASAAVTSIPVAVLDRVGRLAPASYRVSRLGDKAHKLAVRLRHFEDPSDVYRVFATTTWSAEPGVVCDAP